MIMKKKKLIYIPLIIILLIQIFDKNDKLLILQYILLAITFIALVWKLALKRKKK